MSKSAIKDFRSPVNGRLCTRRRGVCQLSLRPDPVASQKDARLIRDCPCRSARIPAGFRPRNPRCDDHIGKEPPRVNELAQPGCSESSTSSSSCSTDWLSENFSAPRYRMTCSTAIPSGPSLAAAECTEKYNGRSSPSVNRSSGRGSEVRATSSVATRRPSGRQTRIAEEPRRNVRSGCDDRGPTSDGLTVRQRHQDPVVVVLDTDGRGSSAHLGSQGSYDGFETVDQ